ncbi:hypothetical protein BN1723_014587 [Verticillium longisporum]|uniref:Uncharacterized protein n=1 Tax=Verticillium longisporum TaxID=100787 RepID=A0A0G4MDJ5_VERLO|nr:hypothetical protein BN1723_014587 [Verticillium longisporum]
MQTFFAALPRCIQHDGFAFSIGEELASIKFLNEDPDRAHNDKESRQKPVVLLPEVEKRNRSDAHSTGTQAHRTDGPQRMLQRVPTVATSGTWNANDFAITDVNTRYLRMDSTLHLSGDAVDIGYYDENLWSMPGTEYLLGAGTEMYLFNGLEHSIVQDDA